MGVGVMRLLSVLFLGFLFLGCMQQRPPDAPAPSAAASPSAAVQAAPELFFVLAPYSGQEFSSQSVSLKLASNSVSEKSAFFNVFVDGGEPVLVQGFNYDAAGLVAGMHKVRVQMLDGEKRPLLADGVVNPASVKEVSFTVLVAGDAEAFAIVKPEAGASLRGQSVNVALASGKFAYGERLFALSVDGKDNVTTKEFSYVFNGLREGKHVLSVGLLYLNSTPVKRPDGSSESKAVSFNLVG